jgi:hypothetical protein
LGGCGRRQDNILLSHIVSPLLLTQFLSTQRPTVVAHGVCTAPRHLYVAPASSCSITLSASDVLPPCGTPRPFSWKSSPSSNRPALSFASLYLFGGYTGPLTLNLPEPLLQCFNAPVSSIRPQCCVGSPSAPLRLAPLGAIPVPASCTESVSDLLWCLSECALRPPARPSAAVHVLCPFLDHSCEIVCSFLTSPAGAPLSTEDAGAPAQLRGCGVRPLLRARAVFSLAFSSPTLAATDG